jgi:hypothetical protein
MDHAPASRIGRVLAVTYAGHQRQMTASRTQNAATEACAIWTQACASVRLHTAALRVSCASAVVSGLGVLQRAMLMTLVMATAGMYVCVYIFGNGRYVSVYVYLAMAGMWQV